MMIVLVIGLIQPQAANVIEHGRAVVRQMLDELDGVLGPADQSGEPPLALDQRQVAQVVVFVLDQGRRTAPRQGSRRRLWGLKRGY